MRKMLGFFYAVVLTLLIFITIYLQGWNPFSKSVPIVVHFDTTVEGLRAGDDVRVDGVLYGKVTGVRLDPSGGVLVDAKFDGPVDLHLPAGRPPGYEIRVESLSVLGGNHVSVRRGTPSGQKVEFGSKTTLIGKAKPSPFDQLGEVVEENRQQLQSFIKNADSAFDEVRKAITSVNQGQGTIGKLWKDPSLYDEAKSALTELKETAGGIRADVANLSQKIDKGEGVVGALLNDRQMKEDLKATTGKIKKIADDLEKVTDKLSKGQGTMGKLFMEDSLYQDAKKALEGLDKTVGRAGRSTVSVIVDHKTYDESEMGVSKLGIRIEPDATKHFFAGAAFLSLTADGPLRFEEQIESGDDDTIIKPEFYIMYRVPWWMSDHLGVKAGLLEGKPGGGVVVDFDLFEGYPVHLEFEARDAYNDLDDEDLDEEIAGPMTRLWAKIPLWKRGDAWYEQILSSVKVFGGVSRIQDDPEFLVGIGLEYRDEDIKTLVGLMSAGK